MLEKDLIQQCKGAARDMGGFLAVVGQRKAKGSGTTKGYPDLTLICSGKVLLIEAKGPTGRLTPDQIAFIARCADQHVVVHVISTLDEFITLVNLCRRY
jgi:hypothetical protein